MDSKTHFKTQKAEKPNKTKPMAMDVVFSYLIKTVVQRTVTPENVQTPQLLESI